LAKFQILSLSGGGIRGLYTAQILQQLEEAEQDFVVNQKFDLICGTSIGGIIALALAYGKTCKEVRDILNDNAKIIFPNSSFYNKWFRMVKSVFLAKYSQAPLKKVLVDLFGEAKLKDLKNRVIIPTVNYSTGWPKVFKTPHSKDYKYDLNISLVNVALATSAAPTYFPIHTIKDKGNFVDGGLIANSPAYCGVHEAMYYLNKKREDISLFSIGTLGTVVTLNDEIGKLNRGLKDWAEPVIELTMSASQSLHEFWVRKILGERYLSIDDDLTNDQAKYIKLDNSSLGALTTLISRGTNAAQNISNEHQFKKLMKHSAVKPNFYEKGKLINE
jgi:patatin-like phospholipase/acyl hydrolase